MQVNATKDAHEGTGLTGEESELSSPQHWLANCITNLQAHVIGCGEAKSKISLGKSPHFQMLATNSIFKK